MIDLAPSLRTAISANTTITGLIQTWAGEPAVFTRRPAPAGAEYPFVMIGPDRSVTDADGLTSNRPIAVRDIAVYGIAKDHYREVEMAARSLRELFHRNRWSLAVTGWDVIEVQAAGPIPAPTDDEKTIGRLVSLTIQLREQS